MRGQAPRLRPLLAMVRTGGSTATLMYLVAEEAWPEDPDMAMKNMNHRLLDEESMEYAQDMLEEGWTPSAVLLELYDICAVK